MTMGRKISRLLLALYWLEELGIKGAAREAILFRGCGNRAPRQTSQLLLAEGLVIAERSGLGLSRKGKNLVETSFPLWRKRKKLWDGHWFLLVFDFPVRTKGLRHSFRGLLSRLGFGRLQRSLFVSPYNWYPRLKRWLAKREIRINDPEDGSVYFAMTSKNFSFNYNLCWPMDELEQGYRQSMKEKSLYRQFNLLFESLLLDPWLPVKDSRANFAREEAISNFIGQVERKFGEKLISNRQG